MWALRINLGNQGRQRHLPAMSVLFQPIPEGILKGHACLVTAKVDRVLYYRWRSHVARPTRPTTRPAKRLRDVQLTDRWSVLSTARPRCTALQPDCRRRVRALALHHEYQNQQGGPMHTRYVVILSMMAGAAVGAPFVNSLSAQTKAPGAYAIVAFSDVGDAAAFKTNVGDPSPDVVKKYGGHFVVRTDSVTVLRPEDPPLKRYVVIGFDSVDQAKAWWNAAEWKPISTYLEQHTKGRAFAVQAIPQ